MGGFPTKEVVRLTAVLEKVGLVRGKYPEQRPRVVTREDVAQAIAAVTEQAPA